MTAMDSDSESQDSDDGRRFRFEATRKDSIAPVNTVDQTKRSHDARHRDRKERSKHENKTDDKDLKHSTKYSRHESKNSRQEDNKNSHKNYRESRSGLTMGDRGFKNFNDGDTRSRDSKRQLDKDRNIYRAQHSREHSYERNYHDERASGDKYRSRYHERHKHRSRDRSRDRSYQLSRVKSSNSEHRSREDYGRHESSKKISVKENRSQNSRDYFSPKNIEPESHNETRSNENAKKDLLLEIQDCKDLDLSQFDVLSETDENMSDDRDSANQTSSLHLHNTELKRRDSSIRLENRSTKRQNNDEIGEKKREELKVKRRNCDPASSFSNNPSAVSDSLLGSTSHTTLLVKQEIRGTSEREKSEYYEEERMFCDNTERSRSRGESSRSSAPSDEIRSSKKDADRNASTYGPLLPPGFTSGDKLNSEISNIFDENKIDKEIYEKDTNFIGPCWLPQLNNRRSSERDNITDASMIEADVFGPVLPPHLIQRQREKDSQDRIIGPVLPDILKSHEEGLIASLESDDDSMMGPLPADHPALRTSRVHEQLDLRAQKIKNEKYSEEIDVGNKREEWMTELPSVQAANLGLGPRKFRVREGPDMSDRSCWTDTPAQKARKQKDLVNMKNKEKRFRRSEEKHVNEFHKKEKDKDRKHEKSLLEMHQSKIAKKKEEEEKEAKRIGISTRRPFDRNIDLQVNRFDQTQKKSILMKAQLLDDRFSRGQI